MLYLRFFVLVVLLFVSSCAPVPVVRPAKPAIGYWRYPVVRVIVEPDAPECLWMALGEAWKLLQPARELEVVALDLGGLEAPLDGFVVVHFSEPPLPTAAGPSNLVINPITGAIVASHTWLPVCDVRLTAHEFGHVLGLNDQDATGHVMNWEVGGIGWTLTDQERFHLETPLSP